MLKRLGLFLILMLSCVAFLGTGCVTIVKDKETKDKETEEIKKTEEQKIFSVLSENDQYLLMAFDKQSTKIPFFDIASFLYNYRLTTKDKTVVEFLKHLKTELTGSPAKIGWRDDVAQDYIDKIKRDYEFIKKYEKGE